MKPQDTASKGKEDATNVEKSSGSGTEQNKLLRIDYNERYYDVTMGMESTWYLLDRVELARMSVDGSIILDILDFRITYLRVSIRTSSLANSISSSCLSYWRTQSDNTRQIILQCYLESS